MAAGSHRSLPPNHGRRRLTSWPGSIRGMDYGICLPNFPDGASREGMEAAAETAERLGWSAVWTTDHVLVATEDADDAPLV